MIPQRVKMKIQQILTILSLTFAVIHGKYLIKAYVNATLKVSTAAHCSDGREITKKDVRQMTTQLKRFFRENESRLAHALQLSFHDCVGGCDGCVDEENTGNQARFLGTRDLLDCLHAGQWNSTISLADFYALAAVVAMEVGVENANVDCEQPPLNRPCMPKVCQISSTSTNLLN